MNTTLSSTVNARERERRSSAVTLSDMEIFIFPELIYSLLLANLMSPRIWRWREDPWFAGLARQKPYRRITRLRQYIMDHYAFNLDLDTWGLTSKERELKRFAPFIEPDALRQSNALFGYEGDRYYFSMDIRSHFGLNKYEGNIIPYWKTETVEAMDAFRHKPAYNGTGAGECVSLAALYAASVFLVAGLPLEDIFLMATPLHSQNFLDLDDGVLTNNRRLVTKKMWFNGTALSAQARRALDNERITVVAHASGVIHTIYPEATIAPDVYARFGARLRAFLHTDLTVELLGNFLRHSRDLQGCFQLRAACHGAPRYLPLERAFAYEEESSFSVTDDTRCKLMDEVESEEFSSEALPRRIVLNDLEDFIGRERVNLCDSADRRRLKAAFTCDCLNAEMALEALMRFCHTEPRLPDAGNKRFDAFDEPLGLSRDMDREALIARLESIRPRNPIADLAFYAYRDLNRTDHTPFLLAAMERSPVSLAGARDLDEAQVATMLLEMPDMSIYDESGRLAQPDEVWNFGRGDGLERALTLAAILRARRPGARCELSVDSTAAVLKSGGGEWRFPTAKQVRPVCWDLAAIGNG